MGKTITQQDKLPAMPIDDVVEMLRFCDGCHEYAAEQYVRAYAKKHNRKLGTTREEKIRALAAVCAKTGAEVGGDIGRALAAKDGHLVGAPTLWAYTEAEVPSAKEIVSST